MTPKKSKNTQSESKKSQKEEKKVLSEFNPQGMQRLEIYYKDEYETELKY